jgi:hypothetical protein
MVVGMVLDNKVGHHQSLVPNVYSLLRTIIWEAKVLDTLI